MWLIVIIIIVFIIWMWYYSDTQKQNITTNNEKINKELEDKGFEISKNIYHPNYILRVSTKLREIAICYLLSGQITYVKFEDILECEILENSNNIMKGGVGRAIAGGIIAGGVGAIVGANTRNSQNVINSLQVRIITKNINNALININLINSSSGVSTSGYEYINAMNFSNEIYATLTAIIDSNKNISEVEKDIK